MEPYRKTVESAQVERRRDPRIVVNAPVEITTSNHKDCQITEKTFIEDVSDMGCRFKMRGPVRKGDMISVRLLSQDGKEFLDETAKMFEVMWVARGENIVVVGARIVGAEKFDTSQMVKNQPI
jgi:PilZ domain